MNKKVVLGFMTLLVACAGTKAVFAGYDYYTASRLANGVTTTNVADHQVDVTYELSRYKEFKNLSELKDESNAVVVADFVEKSSYMFQGIVFSENKFQVQKVLKGDKNMGKTTIPVIETGGEYEGKYYQGEGDQLFGPGRYLLYLLKIDSPSDKPYPVYCVQGVVAGKFKLVNGKTIGYGEDEVRVKAEKISGQDLILQMEQQEIFFTNIEM